MRKTESRQIGNFRYDVTQLGAIEGRAVLARLIRLFGGLVGAMGAEGKVDLTKGFSNLAEGITEEQMTFFCDTFAKWTQVYANGKTLILKDIFDEHFVGEYGAMIEWLGFCLEVNFASFLDGSKGIAALFGRKVEVASPSGSPLV